MLALALIAALTSLPWQPVVHGSSMPGRAEASAFVAGSPAATGSFASMLRQGDVAAVRRVDFRRRVVVAAFASVPTSCESIEIVDLHRARSTLTVTAVVHRAPADVGCLEVVSEAYDVVSVNRRLLGRLLPRRVVLRIVAHLDRP